MVTFGVLGPLLAENEHGPVNLKGPRHRAVLARLLIAKGRVVPVRWLIDDLWGDAPDGALGAVQTFVGALRKALEPDRAPRTPARLLVTIPPGYALRTDPETVDAWRFEAAVTTSAELLADGKAEQARALLDEVLGLWRGPAYAEFAEQDWARDAATRLDELRLLAVGRRAEAALALGQAAEAVPDLAAQVTNHPLREDSWRLLALALYVTGRQGDALATLRRARKVLRTELGVDPGEGLRQLEADILAQAPHLTARLVGQPVGRPVGQPVGRPQLLEHPPVVHAFVGRIGELAELEKAAATTIARRPRLALLSGVAGAGKTALARALTERLAAEGWITAWGTSPELQGAPAAWPWTQMREILPPFGSEPSIMDDDSLADDPVAARFRRHRSIGSILAAVSAKSPVLLVFDDLHWADEETLALLTALATDPDTGQVLIVGTYRSTEISAGLAEALGRAARTEPTRVYLSGLSGPQVQEMVQAITYRKMSLDEVRAIHARSAGNPFFVRELTRLWETEGHAALNTVPAGVRDVIRHRLARLSETAQTHLRQAAIIGQDVDLDVLIPLAGDPDQVLDSIESALLAGFLVESDDDSLRFAHALVQETLYGGIPRARRSRWHAEAAEIIESARPGDVEAIAHHLLLAGSRASAARTAHYTRIAAERAEQRFAPHEAARLWRETVAALDRSGDGHARASGNSTARTSGDGHARARLRAVMGMVRGLAVTGALQEARRHRAEAITAAEALGDPVLTAGVIGSYDVPAIWTANDDEALSARLAAAAERHCALADLAAADHHATAAIRLAERYELPLVGVFTDWYAALRLAITGRTDEARTGHRVAANRLSGTGMPGVEDGILPLALLCLDLSAPDDPSPNVQNIRAIEAVPTDADWGPYESWVRPLILLTQGHRDRAIAAARIIPDSPHDLLFEARTCLHAMVAIQIGDRPMMEHLYTQLIPAAGELAGAGSGLLTLGPTAYHLGNLATALGRPHDAAEHYRQAPAISAKTA